MTGEIGARTSAQYRTYGDAVPYGDDFNDADSGNTANAPGVVYQFQQGQSSFESPPSAPILPYAYAPSAYSPSGKQNAQTTSPSSQTGNGCGANGCNMSGPVPNPVDSPFHTQITPIPNPPAPGQPLNLRLNVTGPNGQPLQQYTPIMGENMHLMMVSSDLKDFIHIHPTEMADGSFVVQAPPLRPGVSYDAMVEFQPQGQPIQTNRVKLNPIGSRYVPPSLNQDLQQDQATGYSDVNGNLRVTLRSPDGSIPQVRAGQNTTLNFDLTDAQTGQPIQDLQNWLGVPIHVMGYTPDDRMAYHWHGKMTSGPLDGRITQSGNGRTQISLPINVSQPGLYKLFCQFNRAGQIITMPFVLNVT